MAKLPFEVTSPDDTDHINGILYGVTGAGKTRLLGTALECEATNPPLVIDTDLGTSTLRGLKVDVTRPRNWTDMQAIYNWLRTRNNKYRSVLIDGLSATQEEQSMGIITGEMDENQVYKNLGRTVVADRQDWLRSGGQMKKFIRAFRRLSYLPDLDKRLHVIMTARERFDEKRRVIYPDLPGALGPACGAYVDILARISGHDTEEGERRLLLVSQYTGDDGIRYLAKNRGGRMGRHIWDPTMQSLIDLWVKEEEGDE